MEKNDDYFNNEKSEAEKLKNVSNMVHSIVNAEPEESLEVSEKSETEELPEIDPIVELVGKTISTHKPKGLFMHGVQTDDHPKI